MDQWQGWTGSISRCSEVRNLSDGSPGKDKNCPGREGRQPKTISLEATPEASKGTLLRLKRTQGNSVGRMTWDKQERKVRNTNLVEGLSHHSQTQANGKQG